MVSDPSCNITRKRPNNKNLLQYSISVSLRRVTDLSDLSCYVSDCTVSVSLRRVTDLSDLSCYVSDCTVLVSLRRVICLSGADPGFQVRGGALKFFLGGISCENSRFYAKKADLYNVLEIHCSCAQWFLDFSLKAGWRG
jgi:hypothetical protein